MFPLRSPHLIKIINLTFAVIFLYCVYPKNVKCFESNRIAIIKSATSHEVSLTYEGFVSLIRVKAQYLETKKWLFETKKEDEGTFWEDVVESRPVIIVTIGTPATKSALKHIKNIPIIYTMTLGDTTDFYLGLPNCQKPVGGISISIPIEKQLKILLEALPMIRRLGIIYSHSQEKIFKNASEFSKKVKINLFGSEVNNYKDIPSALKNILPLIEGLIVPPDPNIYQADALQFILQECFQEGVPFMAFSKQLAISGAPLAIGLDYEDIGRQTAELVIQILSDQNQIQTWIQSPRSILVYINEGVSSKLGLYFSRRTLDKAIIVGKGNLNK